MGLALIVPNISFESANLGRVTIAEDVPLVSLAVSGPDAVTGAADAAQYTAAYTPANTSQRAVTWSIVSGGTYATIGASTGMLSVLEGATSASVTIRVTSQVDNTIYADKTISVTYQGEQILPEGAQPCEFICVPVDGTYINTGIAPADSMSFDALNVLWAGGVDSVLMGVWQSPYSYTPLSRRSSGPMYVGYGGYGDDHNGTYPTTSGVMQCRNKVKVNQSEAVIETYDTAGSLLNTQTITYSDGASASFSLPMAIFGSFNGSGLSSVKFCGGIGRIKVYSDETFTTLIADFVPCYYQGNFGMWDVVSETMFVGSTPGNVYGVGSYWGTNGFLPGVYLSSSALAKKNAGMVTRFFDLPDGCTNIKFKAAASLPATDCNLVYYDSNDSYVGSYLYNAEEREVPVSEGTAKVRMTCIMSAVNDCYIYDMTNGEYIWKGVNVV